MANQRKKGLKNCSTFIPEEQLAAFRLVAERRGTNGAELMRQLIQAVLDRDKAGTSSIPSVPDQTHLPLEESTVIIKFGPGLSIQVTSSPAVLPPATPGSNPQATSEP